MSGVAAAAAPGADARPARATILEVSGLAAGYGRKRVIHDIGLHLAAGEIVLVLGHNGAGKTTLLRTIFGLETPMAGRVSYRGREIAGRPPAANVADGLAFVPQGHGVFRTLSVQDNLDLGGYVERDRARLGQRRETVYALFPILRERRRQIAGTMSGGQQQMLAIGMALIHGPKVILLDEPSIGLAPNLVERVMAAVATVNRELGVAIIIVEQNVALSLPLAHRVVVIKTGGVVYDGDPAPLHDHVTLMKLF